MARVWLIRHGEPASTWGGPHPDPGLSEIGRRQAADVASKLQALGPVEALTSPLARCRETAAPFAAIGGLQAAVTPEVAEIPTPEGVQDRHAWLRNAMAGVWSDIPGGDYPAWRAAVVARVARAPGAAIFTHFVAINACVGAATGSEAVTVIRPAHTAVVTFETDGERLTLVDAGEQGAAQAL